MWPRSAQVPFSSQLAFGSCVVAPPAASTPRRIPQQQSMRTALLAPRKRPLRKLRRARDLSPCSTGRLPCRHPARSERHPARSASAIEYSSVRRKAYCLDSHNHQQNYHPLSDDIPSTNKLPQLQLQPCMHACQKLPPSLLQMEDQQEFLAGPNAPFLTLSLPPSRLHYGGPSPSLSLSAPPPAKGGASCIPPPPATGVTAAVGGAASTPA